MAEAKRNGPTDRVHQFLYLNQKNDAKWAAVLSSEYRWKFGTDIPLPPSSVRSVRTNMLARWFALYKDVVKVTLFKALYSAIMWLRYTQRAYNSLRI